MDLCLLYIEVETEVEIKFPIRTKMTTFFGFKQHLGVGKSAVSDIGTPARIFGSPKK